jgi:hypothetical protein
MSDFVIQLNGYLRIVNEVGFFDGGPQGNIAIWQPGKLEEMRLNLIREGRLRPEAELDGTRLCVQIILPDIELEM